MNLSTVTHVNPEDKLVVVPGEEQVSLTFGPVFGSTTIYLWNGAINNLVQALRDKGYFAGDGQWWVPSGEVGEPVEQYSGPHREVAGGYVIVCSKAFVSHYQPTGYPVKPVFATREEGEKHIQLLGSSHYTLEPLSEWPLAPGVFKR